MTIAPLIATFVAIVGLGLLINVAALVAVLVSKPRRTEIPSAIARWVVPTVRVK